MPRAEKRARDAPSASPHWTIRFDDHTTLKLILDSVLAVVQSTGRALFRVKLSDGSYYMTVDARDPGFTCCISASLQLDGVEFANGGALDEFSFCVDCNQVVYSMSSPSSHALTLFLEGFCDDATINLRFSDPESRGPHLDESRLRTFVDSSNDDPLGDIPFDMVLEMDLPRVKDLMKKAKKAKTEFLEMSVRTRRSGSREACLLTFSVRGETTHTLRFVNHVTTGEDQSKVIRPATDAEMASDSLFFFGEGSGGTKSFHGKYYADKIEKFVQGLPVRTVRAKVKQGMPILLEHDLYGGERENSRIRFYVAPLAEDEEEEDGGDSGEEEGEQGGDRG